MKLYDAKLARAKGREDWHDPADQGAQAHAFDAGAHWQATQDEEKLAKIAGILLLLIKADEEAVRRENVIGNDCSGMAEEAEWVVRARNALAEVGLTP